MSKENLGNIKEEVVKAIRALAEEIENDKIECKEFNLNRETKITGVTDDGWTEHGYTGFGSFEIKYYCEEEDCDN